MAKRSERSRWVTIFTLPRPIFDADGTKRAVEYHDQLLAVVKAFEKVGRVVRVETAEYGNGLILKARKA